MSYPDDFINKILCGDILKIMPLMPRNSIDLVITSPPYNLKNSTGNGMKDGRGGKWANAALQNGYSHHNDCMPHTDYVRWQRKSLRQMFRVLKDDGAIFYNHKWRVQNGLLQDRRDILKGFPVRQIIIWRRKGGLNFNPGYFLPTYEVIYLIPKPRFRLSPKANAYGDVWEFTQEMKNDHPAAFPVALIERIISSTNAQTILDPFMGSGTTAIAARALRRDYIYILSSHKPVTWFCALGLYYTSAGQIEIEGHQGVLFCKCRPAPPYKGTPAGAVCRPPAKFTFQICSSVKGSKQAFHQTILESRHIDKLGCINRHALKPNRRAAAKVLAGRDNKTSPALQKKGGEIYEQL